MRKSVVENRIGLSKDEFNELIQKSAALTPEQEATLENCDLSKSALELIDTNDLAVVNSITNGLNKKYSVKTGFTFTKKVVLFAAITIAAVLAMGNWGSNKKEKVVSSNALIKDDGSNARAIEEKDVMEKKVTSKTPSLPQAAKNENDASADEVTTNKEVEENDKPLVTEDSTITTAEGPTDFKKENEEKNQPGAKDVIVRTPNAKSREVIAIKAIKTVPHKYKGANYQINDLVDYYGGTTALEKELYALLKGNIKNDDIPKSNSSVVFKFEVTAKGKVKAVDVQSVTTPELSERITNTILELDNWDKGKKRIPLEYTVYVTFK